MPREPHHPDPHVDAAAFAAFDRIVDALPDEWLATGVYGRWIPETVAAIRHLVEQVTHAPAPPLGPQEATPAPDPEL